MAERASSSRTAVRMSIAFANNASPSSVEAQPPDEIADNCTAAGDGFVDDQRGAYPRQGSTTRRNNLHLQLAAADGASAAQETAAGLVAGAFQPSPQLPTSPAETAVRTRFDEAGPQHNASAPTDVSEAGSPTAWPATRTDARTPHPSLVGRHHTPTNRWVRFAWEPLATGVCEQRGASSYSQAVAETRAFVPEGSGGGGGGGGRGGGGGGRTSGVLPLNEFSEVSASQGQRHLGVKRFRGSPGQCRQSLAEECDRDSTQAEGCNSFPMAQIPLDGRDGRRSSPVLFFANPRLPESKHAVCATGEATGQAGGEQNQAGSSSMLPGTMRALAGVAATAGRSDTRATGGTPSFAGGAGGGEQTGECTSGGIMIPCRTWGDSLATTTLEHVPTPRAEGCVGVPAAVVATADVAEHQDRHQQGEEQEQQDQGEGHGIGSYAKKAKYRSLRVPKRLSVGHMDSLTNGVSSLGVASYGSTCSGRRSESRPVDTPTSQICARQRQTPFSSARTVCLPERASKQTPSLGGGGASTTGGAGASPCPGAACAPGSRGSSLRTTQARGATPCAALGGPGHNQSKKRQRDGSPPVAAPLFRSSQHGTDKEAPGFDAAVSADSAPFTAAAGGGAGDKADGKGATVAAMAESSAGAEYDGIDDNSSDGGDAHEELSAWLHGTADWWTS